MSVFKQIFEVFSKRPEAATHPRHDIPQTTRNRVLLWCNERFGNLRPDSSNELGLGGLRRITRGGDHRPELWQEIHRRLLYRNGSLQISPSSDPVEAVVGYLLSCPGEQFLNFLEDLFNLECSYQVGLDEDAAVDELNEILRQDNLPYYVTHFVKESIQEVRGLAIYTRGYPRVIMKESEVLHTNAIIPALALLRRAHFRSANSEYLAALDDYRKGDLGDCLTKCGSAFESVLKVLCDRKGWAYKPTDSVGTLIETVLPHTNLDSYFNQLLLIVATLRNRLSSAHGAGTTMKQPTAHIAQYALNATASAILLLAQETGEY